MFNFLRLAMVVIGVLVAQGAVAQDDEGLTRRFLAEAPRAWKRYQEKTVRLTGQYTTIMSKNRAIFLHNRYEIKQNEHCKLLSVDLLHIKQPGEAILFCFNPAYAYTLTKKGKNSAWAIKDVGTDKKQREFIEESRLRAVKQGVDALIRLNSHVDLPALVNHASFKVLGAKALHKDRRELIEIRFDNSHPVKQEPFCPIQKGTILLDPALFWCLRRAQTESIYWPDSVGSDRLEVSLREGPDGFPIPMRVVP
ncbi:MAG: hypothetical protein HYX68_00090 [Planctomycetes bacterium]|nr:hypothetical protein [Planctomycetota bacterium]